LIKCKAPIRQQTLSTLKKYFVFILNLEFEERQGKFQNELTPLLSCFLFVFIAAAKIRKTRSFLGGQKTSW
jgi:hypothetical protein